MSYLLINHKREFVAAFSPKCGCQTLLRWFLKTTGVDPTASIQPAAAHIIQPGQVAEYPHYHKVHFVRDPLRRLVSFYAQWVVHDQKHWCFADAQQRFTLADKSFRRFLYVLEHLHQQQLAYQHHLQSQLDHTRSITFDEVILVEQLTAELEALNSRFGLNFAVTSSNRTQYAASRGELVADRDPQALLDTGIPPAEEFYDRPLIDLATTVYQADVDYYCRAGGSLLQPMKSGAQG